MSGIGGEIVPMISSSVMPSQMSSPFLDCPHLGILLAFPLSFPPNAARLE